MAKTNKINKNVRKLKTPTYRHFKLSRAIKHPGPALPNSLRLFWRSLKLLKNNAKLLGGIILIYGILSLLLVRGVSPGVDVKALKDYFNQILGSGTNQLTTSIALFGFLVNSSGSSTSQAAGAYQLIIVLVISLSLIWALRHIAAGKLVKIRETFYDGMYPLIPFVIILAVITLQLLPAILGGAVLNTVLTNGLAVTVIEKVLWWSIFGFMAVLSLYMVSSSIFALYIVTLPDMTPLKALRSARQLVLHRRSKVLIRVIALPVFLFLIAILIMLPVILYLPTVSEWVLFVLGLLMLAVVHTYTYSLYRELL